MFLEVSSSALITKEAFVSMSANRRRSIKGDRQTVKPGRIKTTPAEEMEL